MRGGELARPSSRPALSSGGQWDAVGGLRLVCGREEAATALGWHSGKM
jgi:hypothetical protein